MPGDGSSVPSAWRIGDPRAPSDNRSEWRFVRRRRMWWTLFSLLPPALIVGGDFYIAGGRMTPAGNAHAEADRIGISISISGFVEETEGAENPHAGLGQGLYCLDDRPFWLMPERAQSQAATVENVLSVPKENDWIDANLRETELTCRTGRLLSEAPESRVAALVTECRGPISIFRP